MASLVSKFHTHSITTSQQFPLTRTFFQTISLPKQQQQYHTHAQNYSVSIYQFLPIILHRTEFSSYICCSTSSCSLSSPPTTKEEAILQARTCLSSTLQKPLNNPKLSGRLKKVKQPRFRVEIPVIDDSPQSLSELALDIFQDIPIKRKGSQVHTVILWPDTAFTEAAVSAFKATSLSCQTRHVNLSSLSDGDIRILNSADVAVFFAPERSNLDGMESVTGSLYPKPVVIVNPRWAYEEESEFGELSGFVGSFDVIYSFTGLEVRGILSKRKGVIFKCVRDGVLSGEIWNVLVEEEDGELKVVSKFKGRPSIGEVETVLYNLMAMNSPITKSAKFFKGLVSNVTQKK